MNKLALSLLMSMMAVNLVAVDQTTELETEIATDVVDLNKDRFAATVIVAGADAAALLNAAATPVVSPVVDSKDTTLQQLLGQLPEVTTDQQDAYVAARKSFVMHCAQEVAKAAVSGASLEDALAKYQNKIASEERVDFIAKILAFLHVLDGKLPHLDGLSTEQERIRAHITFLCNQVEGKKQDEESLSRFNTIIQLVGNYPMRAGSAAMVFVAGVATVAYRVGKAVGAVAVEMVEDNVQ